MSDLAKEARRKSREKAERLTRGDPHQKVDASGYSPPEPMNADVKTGLRPISRRQYKRGGKVEGEQEKVRADRKPRKSGGKVAAFVNRDVREANEDREGTKHVGGFKRGGRTHKADGGTFVPTERFGFAPSTGSAITRNLGLKDGGDVSGTRPVGGRKPRKDGGRNFIAGAIKHPGGLHRALDVPQDETIPAKKMAKAEHSKNPHVRKMAQFAEELHGFKAREDGGRTAYKSGGRAGKAKTNVNVIITTGQGGAPQAPQGPPPMPPRPPVIAPPPQGAPPMGAPMPPQMAVGPGAPPPMQPPMPRKRGGRTMHEEAGGGSGLGRLAKIRAYGAKA